MIFEKILKFLNQNNKISSKFLVYIDQNEIENFKSELKKFLKSQNNTKQLNFFEINSDSDNKNEILLNQCIQIIQDQNINHHDTKIIFLNLQNNENQKKIDIFFLKSLFEKLENIETRSNFVIFIFLQKNFQIPKWISNLFINLNIKGLKKTINEKETFEQKKEQIINFILKNSKEKKEKNNFLKLINKIEKLFYETENFNLNKEYAIEYIKILLKNQK
jgi:hypothetical protein